MSWPQACCAKSEIRPTGGSDPARFERPGHSGAGLGGNVTILGWRRSTKPDAARPLQRPGRSKRAGSLSYRSKFIPVAPIVDTLAWRVLLPGGPRVRLKHNPESNDECRPICEAPCL